MHDVVHSCGQRDHFKIRTTAVGTDVAVTWARATRRVVGVRGIYRCNRERDLATFAAPRAHTASIASAFSGLVTRGVFIDAFNENLSREYQAIIEYVADSQAVKHAAYKHLSKELDGAYANSWGTR